MGCENGCASAAEISVWREGHGAHAHRLALAADFGVDLVMRQRVVCREVGHRDRLVHGRRERAAGDDAELVAMRVHDRRALADRHALETYEADAFCDGARGEL